MSIAMTNVAPNPRCPDAVGSEAARQVRHVAAQAWAEMARHGVLPTPRNFALWFASLDGADPALRRRLSGLLGHRQPVTEAALEAVHEERRAPEIDLDQVLDSTEELQAAAQQCLGHVAVNEAGLRAYGDSLAHWATQAEERGTVDGLARALAALAETTAKASERNRALEQQLHAAAARIARLKHSLVEIRQQATTDALTGLCNRKAFDLRLRQATGRARAAGTPVALLLMDIDHFKRFNDDHGHPVGDLVLRLVGRLLLANVKGRDTAARYGGEEFAIILEGADLRAAATVAAQIRGELAGKRLVKKGLGEGLCGVTLSVGVAALRAGEAPQDLVARADAALYDAKRRGRNRVCVEDAGEDSAPRNDRRTA